MDSRKTDNEKVSVSLTMRVVGADSFIFAETMRRCGFFLGVFSLELPDYLSCNQFTDSSNPDVCVGHKQIRDAYTKAMKPGNHPSTIHTPTTTHIII